MKLDPYQLTRYLEESKLDIRLDPINVVYALEELTQLRLDNANLIKENKDLQNENKDLNDELTDLGYELQEADGRADSED